MSAVAVGSSVKSGDSNSNKGGVLQLVGMALVMVGVLQIMYQICLEAYQIRLYAIEEFGRIIHEFDPYFNYRATVYLYENGWQAFKTWFDYLVWYPLGRPVGTTIYPGMQVTAVAIKNHILPDWSINDICCFVPAWFGTTATLAVAWLTYECTQGIYFESLLQTVLGPLYGWLVRPAAQLVLKLLEMTTQSSWGLRPRSQSPLTPFFCAVAAARIMSIVPAHLLRSVGGGYDNESIAMTAMAMTFACWTCSLRDGRTALSASLWGIITGLAYFYMVAAWGGYVFVLNMVALHAGFLVLMGRYSTKLHRAYSSFYVVGTALATTVPVVGMAPLRSLEQMGAMVGFLGLQLIEICEVIRRRRQLSTLQAWNVRFFVFGTAGILATLVAGGLWHQGYFGPISARVRGLFVKHTKTGNPLVDSVAEHQAASPEAYFQYLHNSIFLLPAGVAFTTFFFFNDSSSFLLVYGAAAYYFSHRMNRLILLTAPIASCLGGVAVGRVLGWAMWSIIDDPVGAWNMLLGKGEDDSAGETPKPTKKDGAEDEEDDDDDGDEGTPAGSSTSNSNKKTNGGKGKNKKKKQKSGPKSDKNKSSTSDDDDDALLDAAQDVQSAGSSKGDPLLVRVVILLATAAAFYYIVPYYNDFRQKSHDVARALSHPTIVNKARTRDGRTVLIDDYREAYFWLRDNTPEDARVMAWWDYGYQITGIANRTTIADGNTWNHEHIALLGRILTSPEIEAHRIARHLADYVLVWAGGGGDDVAKSPHLRRIANSVYRGLCKEPTCREFGFNRSRQNPTKAMEESLLYKLHSNGIVPGVEVDPNRFREVFHSTYGKVRIYKIQSVSKESKKWVANPENRKCDVPGSWFCPGQYPPALRRILEEKKDFIQLGDFNVRDKTVDEDYQREYFENLLGNKKESAPSSDDSPDTKDSKSKASIRRFSPEEIEIYNQDWENNELTTLMYEIIAGNRLTDLKELLVDNPEVVHMRSEDGRGPMWWAHEHGRQKMVTVFRKLEVSETRKDAKGLTPLDVSTLSS